MAARAFATDFSQALNTPVVVENRPGANQTIAGSYVARGSPDGYTLFFANLPAAVPPSIQANLPYKGISDFAPVSDIMTIGFILVTSPDVPAASLKEFVAYLKADPSKYAYGSSGISTPIHLMAEMFNKEIGVKTLHVPYKGAAPAMQDLMAGQIDLVFTSLPSVSGAIKQGTLRPIAVTSARRAAAFQDIPTIAEAGYKDFDVNPWFGLFAPAHVPAAIVRQINADVNELLASPDLVEKFKAQGAEPDATSPEQFAAQLKADIARWEKVVKASGASVD